MLRCAVALIGVVVLAACQNDKQRVVDAQAQRMSSEVFVRSFADGQFRHNQQVSIVVELGKRNLFDNAHNVRADKYEVQLGDSKLFVYPAWPAIDDEGGLVSEYSADFWVYSSIWDCAYFDKDDKVVALGR